MYCSFCGRDLPKGEGCTCCRAVAARNDNPNNREQKSFFRTGTPEEFDHAHGVSYKVDEDGKFDSCQYGGEDQHTRPEYNMGASVDRMSIVAERTLQDLKMRARKTQATSKNQSLAVGCLVYLIFVVIGIIILAYGR